MVIEQWLKFLLRGAKRAPPTVGKREKRETRERADGDRLVGWGVVSSFHFIPEGI
jgi:hypothetical protein